MDAERRGSSVYKNALGSIVAYYLVDKYAFGNIVAQQRSGVDNLIMADVFFPAPTTVRERAMPSDNPVPLPPPWLRPAISTMNKLADASDKRARAIAGRPPATVTIASTK
jgi:hypothetical protein